MEVFIHSLDPSIKSFAIKEKVREILKQPECWSPISSNGPIGSPRRNVVNGIAGAGRIVREFGLKLWPNRNSRRGHQYGTITIHDASVALKFLNYVAIRPLVILGITLRFSEGRKKPSPFDVEILAASNAKADEEATQAAKVAMRGGRRKKTVHAFRDLQCGSWMSVDGKDEPTFMCYYHDNIRQGEFRFYHEGVVLTLNDQEKTEILFVMKNIRSIITQPGMVYPTVTFTLWYPPKFHQVKPGANQDDYFRTWAADSRHQEVAPYCFVYRLTCSAGASGINKITSSAARWHLPKVEALYTHSEIIPHGPLAIQQDIQSLQQDISKYEFCVAFQLEALYINGFMLPTTVKNLLPVIDRIISSIGSRGAASVIKELFNQDDPQKPTDDVADYTIEGLTRWLHRVTEKKRWVLREEENKRIRWKEKSNLVEVHRVSITPAGRVLSGPSWEPNNRVLRKYEDHLDCFIRVDFTEEDANDLFLQENIVSSDHLFQNRMTQLFKRSPPLMKFSSKYFSFLGFSQSSLRNHQCWFVAPIKIGDRYINVSEIIADLGEFAEIRIPGKCAARIGQAFTDTHDCMEILPHEEARIGDVLGKEDKSRIFSDGCGTISLELLEEVWKKRGHHQLKIPPTVYQIRFGGVKGVVSLDTRLKGRMLCIRNSMAKFKAPRHRRFEVCNDNKEPLPMYLNRPLIKLLEDLGVPDKSFLDLQDKAIRHLKRVQESPLNAKWFLEQQNIGTIFGLPDLFQQLYQKLGASFQEDSFLKSILYYGLLIQLRDMKYKSRIKVDEAITLIGIMDETGYLKEGQVYVSIESWNTECKRVDRKVIQGNIVVTKSPSYHPGDVRRATAVEVPEGSPLRALRNCVCFPQEGHRDLPSMLSGGDLDGDLYNIIYDKTLLTTIEAEPAQYRRVEAQDIGRPVTQLDIGEFFLKFMVNDRLGQIATVQQTIGDQEREGSFHRNFIACGELASKAVDFPKTGIEVNASDIPKTRRREKPDFMAPGPRVLIVKDEIFDESGGEDLSDVSDSEEEDVAGNNRGRRSSEAFNRRRRHGRREPIVYYRSQKITGKLYRGIDERAFIRDMRQETKSYHDNKLWSHRDAGTLLSRWRDYVALQMTDRMEHEAKTMKYVSFAEELRDNYEFTVRDSMAYYGERTSPISEVEAFAGFILGKGELAKLTRRQRQDSKNLRDESNAMFREMVELLRRREPAVDGSSKGLNKTLEKCLACLDLAVLEEDETKKEEWQQRRQRARGVAQWRKPLKGFGWVAASVALREIIARDNMIDLDDLIEGVSLL